MLKFKDRKIQQQNDSFYVCLPLDWCRSNGLRKGDLMEIISFEGRLEIRPSKVDAHGN